MIYKYLNIKKQKQEINKIEFYSLKLIRLLFIIS